MEHRIIVDSGCDLTPELKQKMDILSVPLTMRLGEDEYLDDETLNKGEFMAAMKSCTQKVGSAAPSSYLYKEAMEAAGSSFVITLSAELSGSYNSAELAGRAINESGDKQTYVINSKSASAGETLIALKLHELISSCQLSRERIIHTIEEYVSNIKTYFVLENYDNLQKNGRLGKFTGLLIQSLNIKLIMGADKKGKIALSKRSRGGRALVKDMISLIENSGKDTSKQNIVISHCNNPDLAQLLSEAIKSRFDFGNVWIVPTSGLCSLYADHKGIILAF